MFTLKKQIILPLILITVTLLIIASIGIAISFPILGKIHTDRYLELKGEAKEKIKGYKTVNPMPQETYADIMAKNLGIENSSFNKLFSKFLSNSLKLQKPIYEDLNKKFENIDCTRVDVSYREECLNFLKRVQNSNNIIKTADLSVIENLTEKGLNLEAAEQAVIVNQFTNLLNEWKQVDKILELENITQ
jgi:hypothetical protein